MMHGLPALQAGQIPTPPPLPSVPGTSGDGGTSAAGGPSFSQLLGDSIQQVNAMQAEAATAVEALATGGDVQPAEVLTAVQKADLAFRMDMQVRNKLMQAYEEVKQIRV